MIRETQTDRDAIASKYAQEMELQDLPSCVRCKGQGRIYCLCITSPTRSAQCPVCRGAGFLEAEQEVAHG